MNTASFLKTLIVSVCVAVCFGCGSKDALKEAEEREYQKKLKEAQELAEKISKGDIFNEEAIFREKKLNPDNVCNLTADFTNLDLSSTPDFRGDGMAAVYHDRDTTVYYYYFINRRTYKLATNGRNPSFGMLRENEGDIKYIFEYFTLLENSWEGVNRGIKLNNEANYLNDSKLITEIPGQHPYLVNNDTNIIYMKGDGYFILDDKMAESKITREDNEQLRDSRFTLEQQWQVKDSYKDIPGVWITDAEEKNWCQLREAKSLQTTIVIPKTHDIYISGENQDGVVLIRPVEGMQLTIEIDKPELVALEDLFDVYATRVSPISQETLGPDKTKYKGTLRVVNIVQNKIVCEYQTKLHMTSIFAGDIAIAQKDENIMGSII